ncbi:MAG: hypothetical protein ACJ76H_16195 [Bacteriovoracaceae bacterium]
MDNLTLTLILVTNFLLVLVLGAFGFLIYRLIKDQKKNSAAPSEESPQANYHPAILERLKEAQKLKAKRADLFCPNHPDEPGEVMCGICDKLYCQNCIKPFKSLHFCREHLPLVMNYQWDEVMTVKTSTEDPEHGVRIYQTKKEIFEKEELPTYIETHYKINIDQDHIETYLVVFAMKEQLEKIRQKFSATAP